MKKQRKSFTIVELVIVIAVIAILAAVLIPTFSGIIAKSKQSSALQSARNALTAALNMSSTASLPGKDTEGNYRTIFIVEGYAFGYSDGELEAFDYPTNTTKLVLGTNFNAVLLSSENMGDDSIDEKTAEMIQTVTNMSGELFTSKLENNYYLTDGDNVCSCFFNSDISKKVLVLTTFSGEISDEIKTEVIANSGINGYALTDSGTGTTVDFGDIH